MAHPGWRWLPPSVIRGFLQHFNVGGGIYRVSRGNLSIQGHMTKVALKILRTFFVALHKVVVGGGWGLSSNTVAL